MKHSSLINEITISIVFIIFVLLFLDPFMFWMPNSVVYMAIAGLIVLFALFVGFVWKEQVRDEREQLHKMIAARIGYLFGVGVLVVGIIGQTFFSSVDPWLVIALGAMIVAKLISFLYSSSRY